MLSACLADDKGLGRGRRGRCGEYKIEIAGVPNGPRSPRPDPARGHPVLAGLPQVYCGAGGVPRWPGGP